MRRNKDETEFTQRELRPEINPHKLNSIDKLNKYISLRQNHMEISVLKRDRGADHPCED